MLKISLGLIAALMSARMMSVSPAAAADYPVYSKERLASDYEPECGRCGCLIVTTVRHREMRMAFPSASFDPRERDEPNYFHGGMKTYKRYGRSTGPAACAY